MKEPLYYLIVGRGFEQYQPGLKRRFAAHQLGYSYNYCEPADNPALVVNFETEKHMGRMTAWTLGSCYLEVLEVASGQSVYDRHYQLQTEHEFHKKLAEIALFIRGREETN